jgi:hypothetical protein
MRQASKQRKHGEDQKSQPKRVRPRSNQNARSTMNARGILARRYLHNMRDNFVIQKLCMTSVGELAVDGFAAPQEVPALRVALGEVYFKAAEARQWSKATTSQLKNARSASTLLMQAVEKLAKVSTDGRDGLCMLLEGPPLDDTKGERELNELASACWRTKMDIGLAGVALQSAIETEGKKPTKAGERRKRLRTLVNALADWWRCTGGSIAPTVDANRLGDGTAVVHGRRGHFLTLALALFCQVDVFKESEVEAAVTNVYEEQLAATELCRN